MSDEELIQQLRDQRDALQARIEKLTTDNHRWKMECENFWRQREDAAEAERDTLQAKLKTVLDREADTHRRHDAKVDALEARITELEAKP